MYQYTGRKGHDTQLDRDRLKREQTTHLGTDLLENEEEEEEA